MEIDNRVDSGSIIDCGERVGVDGPPHADNPDNIDTRSDGDWEIDDGCLDPVRPDNVVLNGSTQDDEAIDWNQPPGLPDPCSQGAGSHPPSLEPPNLDDNPPSGPDIEELCGIVEDENLALYLEFISLLCDASLDTDMKMAEEDLERLRNPPTHEISLEGEPNLQLTLDLFLANYTSSVNAYNQNHEAIL